jgi:hypothetical protein
MRRSDALQILTTFDRQIEPLITKDNGQQAITNQRQPMNRKTTGQTANPGLLLRYLKQVNKLFDKLQTTLL